jgi:hypothetical protein
VTVVVVAVVMSPLVTVRAGEHIELVDAVVAQRTKFDNDNEANTK